MESIHLEIYKKQKMLKTIMLFSLFLVSALLQLSCTNKITAEYYVQAVSNPIINLNGSWHINTSPEKEFWKDTILNNTWKDVKVPGEVMMQGFSIKNDIPFAYKKEIDIPSDFEGQHIFLQFDGVYSYTRVWVNGNYVRDHHGGFTRWKCDITPFVEVGEKARVTVEVTDRADDISYASGYAKHQIGGILRDVNLLALPKIYPEEIKIETDLDAEYSDAILIVSGALNNIDDASKIKIQLFDINKNEIELKEGSIQFKNDKTFSIQNLISNPEKWDAEHPNLYSLRISFFNKDKLTWSKTEKFGFREVEVDGNNLLVNGDPVKLRGACRHDVHPTLGRVSTPEYELKDVLLAKESNMNYIRTSHYPPSNNFLKLCDEYGLYVEDETAVCFIIDYRIKGYEKASKSQSDPAYTDRYLSQLEEMVTSHRNHPSVIIWSIGNESIYGINFKKSFDWIKDNDKTRPVMFSYPGSAPDSLAPYEILSMHYPAVSGDLNQYGKTTKGFGYKEMPVIHDEWAHVAAYNNQTIKEDANIRNFWGQSLDMMWEKTFDSDGGLGGAIWGMIDETFMLPENLEGFRDWWGINDNTVLPYQGTTVGYGEWGIVDVWRRKKPEFWNTKKAYSPIKILTTTIENYKIGSEISIPIYNRFDHTNLNEITVKYTYKGNSATLKPYELNPHKKGALVLPITEWEKNEKIAINFYDNKDNLLDSYTVKQPVEKPVKDDSDTIITDKITLTDKESQLIIHTNKGDLYFDKSSGLLNKIEKDGNKMNVSGPHMTYRTKGEKKTYSSNNINSYGKDWKLKKFVYELKENLAVISLKGTYNKIKASFDITVDANGNITTNYFYEKLPKEYVRELGVKYNFDAVFDTLSWKRNSYWSAYPKDHLSASSGKVPLYSNVTNKYREAPQKPWVLDIKSFYYEGTANETNDVLTYAASATKEHVLEYSLLKNKTEVLTVNGKGDVSCRLEKKGKNMVLYLNNEMDYVDLSWGNYQRNIILEGEYTGKVRFHINP